MENLRLEVSSKNLSDAKHEIMNDSINRCWLAVRRTRACRFVYMVRVFFLTTYKSYRLCLEDSVLSSAMIADIDSRGMDCEWMATAYTAPVKCPKCGGWHTYPPGFLGLNKYVYRRIWKRRENNL